MGEQEHNIPADEPALEYPASEPGLLALLECLREEKVPRVCDTPSANVNCSRNSVFVRPLAEMQNQRKVLHKLNAKSAYNLTDKLTENPLQQYVVMEGFDHAEVHCRWLRWHAKQSKKEVQLNTKA